MFLAELPGRQQSDFLGLAHKLISADGETHADELAMLNQYRQEMGFKGSIATCTAPLTSEHQSSIDSFQAAPVTIRKKVLFELVALACADHEYAASEHSLLEEICASFQLDPIFLDNCKKYVEQLTGLYTEISKLVAE